MKLTQGERICHSLNNTLNIDGELIDVGCAKAVHDYYGIGQPNNDFALGVRHDKTADWFVRVRDHRKTCRWWNNGTETRFTPVCPPGWSSGRIEGSLAHGNHNHQGENNPHAHTWRLTFDDSSVTLVKSLKSWCRDNNIKYCTLYAAWRDNRPHKHITQIIKL